MIGFFDSMLRHKKIVFSVLIFFVLFETLLPTIVIAANHLTITSINPNPALTKSNGVFSGPLTINGTGFTSNSIVKIERVPGTEPIVQVTTFNLSKPDILITNGLDYYSPGEYPVTVVDGNQTSNAVILIIQAGKSDQTFFEALFEFFGSFWENIIALPIKWVSYLISWLAFYFADLSAKMFKYILVNFVNSPDWSITRAKKADGSPTIAGSIFLSAWGEVRNWANMLIVIGLIGIAVATILRFQEYEAKKLLVPLIIVALLVNFSIVFVGLMIDISNIVTKQFLLNSQQHIDIVFNINEAWNNVVEKISPDTQFKNTTKAAYNILFALIYFVVGLTFIGLSMVFIQRYIWLVILFIFSPLAFVMRVFPLPAAKKIWSDWWSNFIKWCFAGVAAAFFIGLSAKLIEALKTNNKGIFLATKLDDLPGVFILVLLVLGFLFAALKAAQKSNVIAGVVMSATAAIVGAIMTGGASLAGSAGMGALRKTGAAGVARKAVDNLMDSKAVSWVRDTMGGTGTSATARQRKMQERLKEPTSRLENIRDNKELAKVSTSGITAAERAAATNILKSRDSLDEIPAAERQRAMNNTINHDNRLKVSDFVKSDYRYAEFDEKTLKRIQTANPTWMPNQIRAAAVQEQLETNLPSMSGNQRRNIDISHITDRLVTSKAFNANIVRNFKTADRPHIDALRDPVVEGELLRLIYDPRTTRSERSRLINILNEIDDLP